MSDLIKRDEAVDAIYHHFPQTSRYEAWLALHEVSSVDTERKTGKWTISETAYDDTEAKCSECGFVTLVNEPGNGLHMLSDLRFCPNCGAKLEV